jgi:lysophospholipase L1-like esterase
VGTTNNSINSRIVHAVSAATREVRFEYVNAYGNETTAMPNSIVVSAGLELASGTVLPVLFSGNATVTLTAGSRVESDPVAVDLVVGDLIRSRTYVHVTGGQRMPTGFGGVSFWSEGGETGVDLVDKSLTGTISNSGSVFLYGPSAVRGAGGDTLTRASLALVGDSIIWGTGEELPPPYARAGFAQRALADTFQYVQTGQGGDTASNWLTNNTNRLRLIDGSTHAIEEFGTNDLTGGNNAATVAAYLIAIWKKLAARGILVYRTTLTPQTTTTDGYMTLGNQTVFANEAARVGVNDWIRDGAPLVAGAYVAAGSTNPAAIRAGSVGHPLAGYFETADMVESARNSGKWRIDNVRNLTDGQITASSNQLNSATAAFTSADIDKYVQIDGAGTAGVPFRARIVSITNPTRVVLFTTAVTTVTGANVIIGNRTSADGIHPGSYGHQKMATAIDVSAFRKA